jgi:hypothetical protein
MKHTPWPWREHEGFIIGRFNSDNEIHDICDPRCAPADDADTICEMNANTLLIAAAPELLDALECFMVLYEQGQLVIKGDDGNDPIVAAALKAIAKATGEQP